MKYGVGSGTLIIAALLTPAGKRSIPFVQLLQPHLRQVYPSSHFIETRKERQAGRQLN